MPKTDGLYIHGIKTHRIAPGESIEAILDRYLPSLKEKTVVAITSKIVSLCQNRVIPKSQVQDKQKLVQQEADAYLDEAQPHGIYLTIKNNIIIPTAGIDESNVEDSFVLYPQDIPGTVAHIWHYLRKRDGVSDLGVVLTDSHTMPFRRGITGIGLGWCGFLPLHDYIGMPDLYGKPLQVSMSNLLDGIASAAVLVMGEGNEQTPLCVLQGIPTIHFQDRVPTQTELDSVSIALEDDIYAPLLRNKQWIERHPSAKKYAKKIQ